MGVYIEKKQHIISSNIYFENNDPSLIDNVVDIRDIPPIIHPSVHEMLLLTKNIEDNNETIWFIIMMLICFSGIGGIIKMVFVIKK